MIETITIGIPITVTFQIHKGKASEGTHNQIELYGLAIGKEFVSWELEKEILSEHQDMIEDACYDASVYL